MLVSALRGTSVYAVWETCQCYLTPSLFRLLCSQILCVHFKQTQLNLPQEALQFLLSSDP